MKLNRNEFRKKCSEEKYYEALKYMSHTLTGKDRLYFIKQICKCNIYLGAICATTCEYDREIDKYIRTTLNEFFQEKQINYHDKQTGQTYSYNKTVSKIEVERFLLASYEVGNFKAVIWAIHHYDINANSLLKLSQKLSEEEYIEFLIAVSKSANSNKMMNLCRSRTVPAQKNNEKAKRLLKFYWYENRQIFTYLADSFGWLPDLDSNKKYGEMIYAKCFEGSENSTVFNNVIINAIDVNYREGLERLFRIIDRYGSQEVKKNLYILFYLKLQNRFPVYKTDYKALARVDEIDRREIYIGAKTIQTLLNTNASSWINIFELVYSFPKMEEINVVSIKGDEKRKISRNVYPLNRYLEEYPTTPIQKVVYTYFNSIYGQTVYLDDFVMLVSELCKVTIADVCKEISDYKLIGHVVQSGAISYFKADRIMINRPCSTDRTQIGKNYYLKIDDYDYITRRFYVSVMDEVKK